MFENIYDIVEGSRLDVSFWISSIMCFKEAGSSLRNSLPAATERKRKAE